jgi:hypothetical protein
MNTHIKTGLALAIGISLLLVPVRVQPPLPFSSYLYGEVYSGEKKGVAPRFHGYHPGVNGLKGYWYRGF